MAVTYRKISPANLPYNDKEFLRQTYGQFILEPGRATRHIEEVRTLNNYEKLIFEEQQLVSPNYALQFLYKFGKDVDRQELKANLRRNWATLIERVPELRVNFAPLGYDYKMHKIIMSHCSADIRHISLNRLSGNSLDRSLASLMQDDRQRPFDLKQDFLIRFTLVRTDDNEYAIILTYPRLLSRVFKRIYLPMVMNLPKIPDTLKLSDGGENFVEMPISHKMKSYWRGLMKNLPSRPKLPGLDYAGGGVRYRPGNYTLIIDHSDLLRLKELSQDNRGIIVAILQTAWGLLQRLVNYCRDTYFCLIMNEHTLLVEEEARKSVADRSGEIIPLPIRIFCEDYMLIRDIVETQLRQMLVSYKVPCRNMRRFLEDIGQPRDLFPYFLYFDGFAVGKKSYSRTKGTQNCELVESVGYDAAQVNLSVHFEMDATDIKAHFRYNAYVFSGYTAEPLAKNYAVCLHNLLYGWDDRFEEYSQKTLSDMGKWNDTFDGYIY